MEKNLEITLYDKDGASIACKSFYEEEDNLPVMLEQYLLDFMYGRGYENESLTMTAVECDADNEFLTSDDYTIHLSHSDVIIELI